MRTERVGRVPCLPVQRQHLRLQPLDHRLRQKFPRKALQSRGGQRVVAHVACAVDSCLGHVRGVCWLLTVSGFLCRVERRTPPSTGANGRRHGWQQLSWRRADVLTCSRNVRPRRAVSMCRRRAPMPWCVLTVWPARFRSGGVRRVVLAVTSGMGGEQELLVGLDNGEVLLMDVVTMSQLAKFNSSATLNSARVTDLKWVPTSRSLFLVVSGLR
jgi:hypothetical protein